MVEKCFISYSRKDYSFVDFLQAWFEFYPDHVECWRDTKLEGGNEWKGEINYHIDHSNIFIAVATSNFFYESRFCQGELTRFRKRMSKHPNLRIIPIKLDDLELKEVESNYLPVSKYQWIDFRQWLTKGDKIFIEQLLPTITRQPFLIFKPYTDNYLVHSAIELNALKEIVIDYCNKFPRDAKAPFLFTLVSSYLQNPTVDLIAKVELAIELSNLYTQRGEWLQAFNCCDSALSLLKEKGISKKNLTELSDREKILIGRNLRQLGLLSRQLGNGKCEQYLKEALTTLEVVTDPILRNDNCAQVHRELSTFFMSIMNFEQAQTHINKSQELLTYIPSQRFHAIQAKNKQAQLAILRKQFNQAEQILDEIWLNFGEREFAQQDSMIVYCQVLITKIFLNIVTKQPGNVIRELIKTHYEVANNFGLLNEKRKNFLLSLLVPFRKLLPFWLLRRGLGFYFRTR